MFATEIKDQVRRIKLNVQGGNRVYTWKRTLSECLWGGVESGGPSSVARNENFGGVYD